MLKRHFVLLKEAFNKWLDDGGQRLGAALSYYSLFSLGPLLLIAVSTAGIFFGEEAVSGELFYQIRGLIGDQGAEAVQMLLQSAHKPETASIAGLVGVIALLIGATSVVIALKEALNLIWGVKPKPGRGIIVFLRKYILSLAAVLSFGFLLMISLIASAALTAVERYVGGFLPVSTTVMQYLNLGVSFVLLTALVASIFKFLPDMELTFREVLPGAALTSVIGAYLGRQGIGSTFGAAGSLVVGMVWIYYTAQILYFGAELTEVYTRERHPDLQPSEDAEFVVPLSPRPVSQI
jgi:membrane protein